MLEADLIIGSPDVSPADRVQFDEPCSSPCPWYREITLSLQLVHISIKPTVLACRGSSSKLHTSPEGQGANMRVETKHEVDR